jgi:hypothetical protein
MPLDCDCPCGPGCPSTPECPAADHEEDNRDLFGA